MHTYTVVTVGPPGRAVCKVEKVRAYNWRYALDCNKRGPNMTDEEKKRARDGRPAAPAAPAGRG